ncbi:DUF1194 domain-containing protein [Synechococcus sp. FACHB-909]|uniref:DUF1194 domain-containing protein n=1 Tax=Synechococcus sp. FACHB-909 TaxID=2692863 RepID=UPI0016885D4D|nr:DUF1194 domain-containing protein [Synechococcus sp. FACHB-909]MBD2718299.1 DUF1194 domain-containing protein [Synechococcus sp. FACHB-909]
MRSTLKPLLRGGAAAAAVTIGLFGTSQPAHAVTNVFQELFLSLDVSGSIDNNEFTLYRDGYVSAFQDAAVKTKIAETFAGGGLAIAVGQWSTIASPTLAIDWKHITDLTTDGINGGTSLNSFVTALQNMNRQGGIGNRTCIDCGMLAAINAINTNLFNTTRVNGKVIDISTDGVGNEEECPGNVTEAQCAQTRRAQAVASGIIINGLGVGAGASGFLTANVATPANGATKAGFVETAADFDAFETAITNKLIREVGPGPGDSVPGPLPVLGAAAAFGFSRKLRRRINTANLHQA